MDLERTRPHFLIANINELDPRYGRIFQLLEIEWLSTREKAQALDSIPSRANCGSVCQPAASVCQPSGGSYAPGESFFRTHIPYCEAERVAPPKEGRSDKSYGSPLRLSVKRWWFSGIWKDGRDRAVLYMRSSRMST